MTQASCAYLNQHFARTGSWRSPMAKSAGCWILALLLTLPMSPVSDVYAQDNDRFVRISPEQAGYSAEKLKKLEVFLASSGSDSLLLLHDGKVFFEWGDIRKKILVHSMRKALLNSLYGIYQARGMINLDMTMAELTIDDIPPVLDPQEKSAKLADVLKSRSGIYHPAAAESEQMSKARPQRKSHRPGEFYYYNNWDFNVAGFIFEQRTGKRIYDAFYQEIAQPLGMLDYHNNIVQWSGKLSSIDRGADGFYQPEPELSKFPAYHFRMSAHDLALYGQLFLNDGRWGNSQIIPSAWIQLSTRPYSEVDPQYGLAYGMLWDVLIPANQTERPSFYHTGAGVHMLGVYPKHKLVLVHRVDTEQSYRFNDGDLYQIIRMVHGARLKPAG
jgi:CubicO group peptidase (beta-lactamase class C family)